MRHDATSLAIQALDKTACLEFPNKALIGNVLESQFRFGAGGDLVDDWLNSFSRRVWGRGGFIGVVIVSLVQYRRLIFSQVPRHNFLTFGRVGFEIVDPFDIRADKFSHRIPIAIDEGSRRADRTEVIMKTHIHEIRQGMKPELSGDE